ncbi:lipopolysaccharide biosynthesis protein [Aliivibrio fischeri]|uniref:lipopolysaccharide biosynthesis protein n=1 Tax=Aliivibrio fischeri TaxID=668 RepID=UPI000AB34F43|nr:hypothetical protein [Aliivibrio fischeri]
MKNKKILHNTLMLYTRQILIIFVSLYTVRVVLKELGVEEYGIYTVVAGIVALCSFLSGSMASATQRFFSYALGKKDNKLLNTTFSVNLVIYMFIAIVAFFLLKTIGFWFVDNYLSIPLERKESAIILYEYSIYGFLLNILVSPLIAVIIAHEDMKTYAYLSINEAIMKLSVVFLLGYISLDKLELYGLLLLLVSIINFIVYFYISYRKYEEIQFKKLYWDYFLLKEIFIFTGWTIFGQFTTIIRSQAVTILINQFFNPSVVAARAIANTVASQVNMFSNNFNTGLYPPLIKSYAEGNNKEFLSLIYNGSKLTFFLFWVFALPLSLEIKTVFSIWLGDFPEDVILFTRLALVEALIFSISLPLTTAARAPGKIKIYELSLGLMQILIFIFSYIALKLNFEAYSVFIIAILVNIIMFFVRLVIISKLINLIILDFIKKVIFPIINIIFWSLLICFFIYKVMPESFYFSILNMVLSCFFSCVLIFFFGIELELREKIKNKFLIKISWFL